MIAVSFRVRVPPPAVMALQQDPAKKVDPEQSPRSLQGETEGREQSSNHLSTLSEDQEAFVSSQ
jgi:hypothetical protein